MLTVLVVVEETSSYVVEPGQDATHYTNQYPFSIQGEDFKDIEKQADRLVEDMKSAEMIKGGAWRILTYGEKPVDENEHI